MSADAPSNTWLATRLDALDGPFSNEWERLLREALKGGEVSAVVDLGARLGWHARRSSDHDEPLLSLSHEVRTLVGSLHLSQVGSARRLLGLPFPQVKRLALPAFDALVPDLLASPIGPLEALAFTVSTGSVDARAVKALFADARFRSVRALHLHAYESTTGVPDDALRALAETPFDRLESLELVGALSGDLPALEALVSAPWFRGLRRLSLGHWPGGRRSAGDPLTGQWTRLFQRLDVPLLEQLELELSEFSDRDLSTFAARPWPRLCRLMLGRDTVCGASASTAFVAGAFPMLRALDAGCVALDHEVASRLVAQPWSQGLQQLLLADAGGGARLESDGFQVQSLGPFLEARRVAPAARAAPPAVVHGASPAGRWDGDWSRAWVALSVERTVDQVCETLEGWFPDRWVSDFDTWASLLDDADELPEVVVAVERGDAHLPTRVLFHDLRAKGERRAPPDTLEQVRVLAQRFSEAYACRAACDGQGLGRPDDVLVWEGGKAFVASEGLSPLGGPMGRLREVAPP